MRRRRGKHRSGRRRGSLAVTLTLFFVSLILLLGTLTEAASGVCGGSLADGVLRIAGRSVLSEYDRNLWERYGLLGVRLTGVEMKERLHYYLEENLMKSRGILHLQPEKIEADPGSLLLTCPDVLETEILEYMKGRILPEKASETAGETKALKQGVTAGVSGKSDADFIQEARPVMTATREIEEKAAQLKERWEASEKTEEDRKVIQTELEGLKVRADRTLEQCELLHQQRAGEVSDEISSAGAAAVLGVERIKKRLEDVNWEKEPDQLFSQFSEGEKEEGETNEKSGHSFSDLSTEQEITDEGGTSEAVLRNRTVMEGLPSVKMEVSSGVLRGLDVPRTSESENLLSMVRNNYYVNQYVRAMFRDRLDGTNQERSTFFQNEIEYLLCGGYSDRQNGKKTSAYLFTFRTGLNLITIYADPSMREELTTLALSMAPGPTAVLAQAILAGVWAAAEGVNDVRLLLNGETVPLWKTKENWALPLECVFEVAGGTPVRPTKVEGSVYKDYLTLFLNLLEQETKLVRIMDLIQLNLKGGCDSSFEMSDCAGGFHSSVLFRKASGFPAILPKGFREKTIEQTHLY